MIRPFTLLTLLFAAGSGLYLYQAKQQGRVIDRRIADLQAATQATRQRAEVLRAEYTLLNDPSRLGDLVAAHLPDLKPTLPAQWTSLAELDKRLPPVGAPTAAPPPLEPSAPDAAPPEPPVAAAPPTATPPTATPAGVPVAEAAKAEAPKADAPKPEAPAHTREAAKDPPRHASPPLVARAAVPHPVVAAAHEAPPRPRPPVRIAATPAWTPPSRANARAAVPAVPVMAALHPAPAPAAPPAAPQPPPAPVVASALGMARTMFAPVTPVSAATLPSGSTVR